MNLEKNTYEYKVSEELRRINEDKAISEENKKIISFFVEECYSQGIGLARIRSYLQMLKILVKDLEKPLEKYDKEDVKKMVSWIERSKYAEWTKHNYKVTLKKFFKTIRKTDDHPEEVRWIKTSIKNCNKRIPEEILIEEEIKAIVESADLVRDKALIMTLYESGCRITELMNLKIKHIQFDEYGAKIIVSGKTGMRRIRLVSSAPLLASWLDQHYNRNDPDDYVWISLGWGTRGEKLHYNRVRMILNEVAKKAKIKKRVNPHSFRHARATYLASHLTEANMRQFFGWTPDSDMAGTYVHLNGRETDDALLKIHGLKTDEYKESVLKAKQCPRCRQLQSPVSQFCAKCGLPLNEDIIRELEKRKEEANKLLNDFVKLMLEKFPEESKNMLQQLGAETILNNL